MWPDPDILERSDWETLWERHSILRVHPIHIVDEEDLALIEIWASWRRDSMGGAGHLPFSGGYAEQPAALMKALEAMEGAAGRVKDKYRSE